jgi:PhnB protein
MKVELFINFDGNCRAAVEFYSKVFNSPVEQLQTYADAPPNPDDPIQAGDENRIMYAGIKMGDSVTMFSDAPSNSGFVSGTNICPTLSLSSTAEFTQIFDGLKEGGEVYMEPEKTFFSELFAMLKDKFGIVWQLTVVKE